MNEYQTLDAREEGTVTIIVLNFGERLGFDAHEVLVADMMDLVETFHPKNLLVNLTEVDILASDSIGALLRVRRVIQQREGQMKLCCLKDNVREIFQLLNLEGTAFQIYDTEPDGIAAFAK